MLINIAYGLSAMAVCLFLQSLLLVAVLFYYKSRESLMNTRSFFSKIHIIGGIMILLLLGNLVQVGVWAMLYRMLGEFSSFDAAFYHSAVNFATLGYGDIVMSAKHKLLGPLEAINGILMIGVSTAVLLATFQNAIKNIGQKN